MSLWRARQGCNIPLRTTVSFGYGTRIASCVSADPVQVWLPDNGPMQRANADSYIKRSVNLVSPTPRGEVE